MSKKSKQHSIEGVIDSRLLIVLRLAAIVALVVSLYLSYVSLGGGPVAGCGPESGCDKVLQTRWSKWLGLPVSLFAVATYAGMLALTFRLGGRNSADAQRRAWLWLLPGAVLILGSVLWFVGVQLFVIKQLCKFCMAVHVSGLVLGVVTFLAAPFRQPPEKPWQADKQVFIQPGVARQRYWLALGTVGLLVLGQVFISPQMYSVQGVAGGKLKARTFEVYNGQFQFDLGQVPLIGSPQASNVMVSLFDYTCHHCRELHHLLIQAQRTFSNQLAIINLPMPLDKQCNPSVRWTPPVHTNACEYARLGLAVWRAKREAQHQFDEFIFAPNQPPPLSNARDFAVKLVGGTNQLTQALGDPWVAGQLNQSMQLYATNSTLNRNGAMPQLLIGTNLTGGNLGKLADLYRLLDTQLGLRDPNAAPVPTPPVPNQPKG